MGYLVHYHWGPHHRYGTNELHHARSAFYSVPKKKKKKLTFNRLSTLADASHGSSSTLYHTSGSGSCNLQRYPHAQSSGPAPNMFCFHTLQLSFLVYVLTRLWVEILLLTCAVIRSGSSILWQNPLACRRTNCRFPHGKSCCHKSRSSFSLRTCSTTAVSCSLLCHEHPSKLLL